MMGVVWSIAKALHLSNLCVSSLFKLFFVSLTINRGKKSDKVDEHI